VLSRGSMEGMGGSQFLGEDSCHRASLGAIHRTLPRLDSTSIFRTKQHCLRWIAGELEGEEYALAGQAD
jgi:hypothetical protein